MDINNEIDKLNKFINNKEIRSFEYSSESPNNKIEYLLYVLELTYEHPEIETYLKQLLENFSFEELNNFYGGNDHTILHSMMNELPLISLNSFEIIINFGIDVNSQTETKNTPIHYLTLHYLTYELLEQTLNIIDLFVRYGADLNLLNNMDGTVLDVVTNGELNENLEIIIMKLIDLGAKTNNPYPHANENVLEFIESYRSNNIKPAIKNKIKI